MKVKQFTTTILEADEDKFLTQADPELDILERLIGKKIALGKHDSAENWVEVTAEEADAIKAAKEVAEENLTDDEE